MTPYSQGYNDTITKIGGYWQNVVGMNDPGDFTAKRDAYFKLKDQDDAYWNNAYKLQEQAIGKKPERKKGMHPDTAKGVGLLTGAGLGGLLGGAAGLGLSRIKGGPHAKAILGGTGLLAGLLGGGTIGRAIGKRSVPKYPKTLNEKELQDHAARSGEWMSQYKEKNLPPENALGHELKPKDIGGEYLGWLGKYVSFPEMVANARRDSLGDQDTGSGYISKEDLLRNLEEIGGWDKPYEEGLLDKVKSAPYNYFTSTEAF